MAMRSRIGVLTFHKCINYGSYWQARCLVEGLRRRGYDAEILDHDCKKVSRAEARCALQPNLPQRTPRADLGGYKAKARKFGDAIARLPKSASFSLHEPENAGHYDAIVVGSDEVWNFSHPWYAGQPLFFGEALSADRLVSYAASFGNYSCHSGMDEHSARRLKRFDRLSVRDNNSYWLVRGSTGVDPELVLDPCLQFPEAIDAPATADEPYALVYGHGFPEWLQVLARQWARRNRVRLLSVGYANGWADQQDIEAGPLEFARLMKGSRAVITNFFHGCIFAMLNGKPWAASPSDYRAIKIPDLATALGAEQRIVTADTCARSFAELLGTAAPSKVERRLAELRQRSDAYLDAALS